MLNYTGTGRGDYEEVLRALGYFIDQNNMKEVCIIELKEGLLVRGLIYSSERSGFQTISESFLFTNEDIEKIVNSAYERRGGEQGTTGGQKKPPMGGFGGK